MLKTYQTNPVKTYHNYRVKFTLRQLRVRIYYVYCNVSFVIENFEMYNKQPIENLK